MPEPNVPNNAIPITQYGRNLVMSIIAMPNRSHASSSNSSSYRLIVSPSSIVCSVCADIT